MSYIIENITQKEVNTKFGPKPAFTVHANGDRFSYGFKKPTFKIGDTVDFQYTENTYGKNVDLASVRLLSKGEGASAISGVVVGGSSPGPKAYSNPAKVFPIPPLHGDRAIVRQNSITNAVKAVADILDSDDMNIDLYVDTIISVARKFEAYSCGDLDAAYAEEMVAKEA
jgi:hypothetical protein